MTGCLTALGIAAGNHGIGFYGWHGLTNGHRELGENGKRLTR
jgi:hypothetical protein